MTESRHYSDSERARNADYPSVSIKRVEVNQYNQITAVEFGEDVLAIDAMAFLIDYSIAHVHAMHDQPKNPPNYYTVPVDNGGKTPV